MALFFGPFAGIPIELQVGLALAALTVGIPHGAVDHLITLPSLTTGQRIVFFTSYLGIVGLVIWAILSANVLGFQLVVLMSAIHFGLGDAAFVSELHARKSDTKPFPKLPFALASGFTPVVIPLVSAQSTQALQAVNSNLVDWSMGFAPLLFVAMTTISCAAIIWRDAGKAELAANALRLTARDMLELGLIDGIVPEPNGGAQNNWDESAESLGKSLKASLDRLAGLTPKELVDHRYEKFRKIGSFFEG